MDPKKNMLKNIKAKAVKSMKKVIKKSKGGSITKTEGKTTSGVTSNYENYKAPKVSTGPAPAMKKGGIVKAKKKK